MDPWEVVKWVAIFRLIIPDALFRLCGGRVENLDELQPLAVKAGLNGVMMGNFLTTLGAEPADDRAMFEELGLNVARQPDNGANPRPDNRDGWLEGETPRTPIDDLIDSQAEADFWDPSTQLRVVKKKRQAAGLPAARDAAAARRRRRRDDGDPRGVRASAAERLEELREAGLYRRMRIVEGAQGPRVRARRPRRPAALLEQLPRASPATRRGARPPAPRPSAGAPAPARRAWSRAT